MKSSDQFAPVAEIAGSSTHPSEWTTRCAPVLSRRQMLIGVGLLLAGCGSASSTTASTTQAVTQDSPPATAEGEQAGEPLSPAQPEPLATPDAGSSIEDQTPPPPEATEPPTEPTAEPTTEPAATETPLPTGIEPVRIEIPVIGVDATVIRLDIRGEPEVPEDFSEVGWYHQTRLPGELGPAVVAGHIDSRTGPGVFYRLDEVEAGSVVTLTDPTGETRTFTVTSSGQYSKDALPEEVFGFGEPAPELRLITCGGTFDTASGHYRDNYVVYARADEPALHASS